MLEHRWGRREAIVVDVDIRRQNGQPIRANGLDISTSGICVATSTQGLALHTEDGVGLMCAERSAGQVQEVLTPWRSSSPVGLSLGRAGEHHESGTMRRADTVHHGGIGTAPVVSGRDSTAWTPPRGWHTAAEPVAHPSP